MFLRLLLLCCALACGWGATLPITTREVVAGGLDHPVGVTYAPGDAGRRLFVIEQYTGKVRIVTLPTGEVATTPFVTESGVPAIGGATASPLLISGEQGLLGIAFHPDFASNGYFYLNCTIAGGGAAGRTQVVRYTANPPFATATTANTASRVVVLEFNQPEANHNGGWLGFGADGLLYISAGDGGGGGDNHGSNGNGQNLATRLGKILRINVDDATQPYTIPNGNMSGAGIEPTIFAFGLRNPWRCSFDRSTGDLWIGDVGQDAREEIDYNPARVSGRNYGWRYYEGLSTYRPADTTLANGIAATPPVLDYPRGTGVAVIGGYVYRGNAIPALRGTYIYGDNGSQRFFSFTAGAGTASDQQEITALIDPANRVGSPSSFGEDADGELYICDYSNGRLHQIVSTIVATKLAFLQQPTTANVGAAIAPAVRVAVQDAGGATVTSSSAAVTLTLGNAGTTVLGGTRTVNAVSGVATFANLTLDQAGTSYTLTAAASGLAAATSTAFNVLAQVATPVITHAGGSFSGPLSVQITCPTAGSTIHYTTDGTTPGAASPTYAGAFSLAATKTVRAIAMHSGFANSAVAVATITVNGATPYGMAVRPPAAAYLGMPTASTGTMPAHLSGTGTFSDAAALTPAPALIPYGVNVPFWSDGALKSRWVSVPNDGAPFGAGETVGFTAAGAWTFPAGTVFVKHFDLVTDERTPAVRRRLETRLLVRDGAGAVYGITYRWNIAQSDADAVTSATSEDIVITTANGGTRTQRWYYPSPADCLLCHTEKAGFVLGVQTRQLNGRFTYPGGVADNQLRTWSQLGMFTAAPSEAAIPGHAALAPASDATASLERRARSYLDSNCANCHRPLGAPATFDARYDTPFASQGLVNGNVSNALGIAGAKVVAPHDTGRSILYQRMHTTGAEKMPPLGRNQIDEEGSALIAQWIGAMDDAGNSGGGSTPPPSSGDGGSKCGVGTLAAFASLLLLGLGLRRRS